MILGITGSFGSGKTTIANIFKKYGFEVINADKLYHGIYNKNEALRNKIKKEFDTLDRNKIKKVVFNDYKTHENQRFSGHRKFKKFSRELRKLNNITHPIIIKEIKKEIGKLKRHNKDARIIVDVPLLFEAKMQNMFDKTIVIKCNQKTQIKRLLKKKKYSEKEIKQIIKSQMPLREKIRKADFVVDNSQSLKDAEKQTDSIIGSMQKP